MRDMRCNGWCCPWSRRETDRGRDAEGSVVVGAALGPAEGRQAEGSVVVGTTLGPAEGRQTGDVRLVLPMAQRKGDRQKVLWWLVLPLPSGRAADRRICGGWCCPGPAEGRQDDLCWLTILGQRQGDRQGM
jgi:hypothetical protein